MERKESLTRRRIIDVASAMITEHGTGSFRIVDLAERAGVGVPTIYYHFDSRTQVIAEAQMAIYLVTVEPLHLVLERVEAALVAGDEAAYWDAVRENLVMAWSSGQVDQKTGIVRLLLDVWADPAARQTFCEMLDAQFERWVGVVEDAKAIGWIHESTDAKVLIAVFWAASVGQMVTANSTYLSVSPQSVGEFYMNLARATPSAASLRLVVEAAD